MTPEATAPLPSKPIRHRVLSLDGGGAKGVYTLGFLSRLEKDVGKPLNEFFDLIYGTSTGSIIATLLSLGESVEQIYKLYLDHIPNILSPWTAKGRSENLAETVAFLIGKKGFSDLRKPTGIVATNWETHLPLVFKNYDGMAHSGKSAFIPGFGVSLVDAIRSSCSAVPLFKPVHVTLKTRGDAVVPAYDGGFAANNPSLFALVDAKQLGFALDETALFSVGVGHYPAAAVNNVTRIAMRMVRLLPSVELLGGVLDVSSNTTGILQKLMLKEDIPVENQMPLEIIVKENCIYKSLQK
jgi:patatin-like phospholipase/acyl hydrolase